MPLYRVARSIFLIILVVLLMKTDALGAGASGPAPLPREKFHLFLLAGQSNMAGRGAIAEEDRVVHPRIRALNAKGEWVPAVDPIHWDKPVAGTGLARSFALEYLKEHPDVTVGLIPAACGGSPISTWQPGVWFDQTDSHPYDDAIARARRAMMDGTLMGVLWHQGESDCHPGLSEVYLSALADLIARFRADLNLPRLPVVVGQLGQFDGNPWGEQTHRVDAATREVAAADPRIGFALSDGLGSMPDNIHFSADALREFGKRYFAAFRAAAAD